MLGVLELRQHLHANDGNITLYAVYSAAHGELSSSTSATP